MKKNYTALGFIETTGMVPALVALDYMLKKSDVNLVAYENIGSTLVTVIIAGDVEAVDEAVKIGKNIAEGIGDLTSSNVISGPVEEIKNIIEIHGIESQVGGGDDVI